MVCDYLIMIGLNITRICETLKSTLGIYWNTFKASNTQCNLAEQAFSECLACPVVLGSNLTYFD